MTQNKISRAREAFTLANDMKLDLIMATQIFRTFHTPALAGFIKHEHLRIGINRVCLFHIIVTLAKWLEFYDRYLPIIPPDARSVALQLKKDIESKGIKGFRDKVAGHIWDKTLGRPLTFSETKTRLDAIIGSNLGAFLLWVNDLDDKPAHGFVIKTVEHVQGSIRRSNSFTNADLL